VHYYTDVDNSKFIFDFSLLEYVNNVYKTPYFDMN